MHAYAPCTPPAMGASGIRRRAAACQDQPRPLLFTFSSRRGDSRYALTPGTAATLRSSPARGAAWSNFSVTGAAAAHGPLLSKACAPSLPPASTICTHLSCTAARFFQVARNCSPYTRVCRSTMSNSRMSAMLWIAAAVEEHFSSISSGILSSSAGGQGVQRIRPKGGGKRRRKLRGGAAAPLHAQAPCPPQRAAHRPAVGAVELHQLGEVAEGGGTGRAAGQGSARCEVRALSKPLRMAASAAAQHLLAACQGRRVQAPSAQ